MPALKNARHGDASITLELRMAWWFRPAIEAVIVGLRLWINVHRVLGITPNMNMRGRWVSRLVDWIAVRGSKVLATA
jgi:hypothetical protein